MKRIVFTVTNDLNFDQRMTRIATSLSKAGYSVLLVGCNKHVSSPLLEKPYRQKRISLFFTRGFGFYAEYNTRLFFYLLFQKADIVCGIDLDTLLPVWLVSKIKGKKRVYDAHEFFSQQNEVLRRPRIYRWWHWLERKLVPRFPKGYTVSQSIADEFKRRYGVEYSVIRNVPVSLPQKEKTSGTERFLLYQGAVNESRGLEYLVPAMKQVNARLLIYGDGNFIKPVKELIRLNNLGDQVLLNGMVLPLELDRITTNAYLGINLVEHTGLNQYYSLANKFFDYIQAEVPQLSMDFPEYRRINEQFEVAVLISDLLPSTISDAINQLLQDRELYERLRNNCRRAKEELNWEKEKQSLLDFYQQL